MENSYAADLALEIVPRLAQFSEILAQASKGRITKARLQAFIIDGGVPPTYKLAHSLLKGDFIIPEEILGIDSLLKTFAANNLMKLRASKQVEAYTSEQFRQFDKTLPSKNVLHWLRDNNYVLMAGPPEPMSLLDVFHLNPGVFHSSDGSNDPVYIEKELKKLSCEDKVGANWLTLRRGTGNEGIFPKKRKEQLAMLSKEERVPNIAEAAWCFTIYGKICTHSLTFDKFFRTSSVSQKRNHIYIGVGGRGLHIGSCSDSHAGYYHIAVSRKI